MKKICKLQIFNDNYSIGYMRQDRATAMINVIDNFY